MLFPLPEEAFPLCPAHTYSDFLLKCHFGMNKGLKAESARPGQSPEDRELVRLDPEHRRHMQGHPGQWARKEVTRLRRALVA